MREYDGAWVELAFGDGVQACRIIGDHGGPTRPVDARNVVQPLPYDQVVAGIGKANPVGFPVRSNGLQPNLPCFIGRDDNSTGARSDLDRYRLACVRCLACARRFCCQRHGDGRRARRDTAGVPRDRRPVGSLEHDGDLTG